MVQNGDNVMDGADEKMLTSDEKERLAKKEEVKFISGDQQNGDAKIDIGTLDKAFTGMTKEELMKYANDPFWIRLRWILFIIFWLLWIAMLIGAIMIIINAPKCAAPTPLSWYKQGPLVKFDSSAPQDTDLSTAQKVKARGVIYALPAEDTYSVNTPEVKEKVKKIVDHYKDKNMKVILDLTPNYISGDSQLFKEALEDESKRSPFVWSNSADKPTNWVSTVGGSAWKKIENNDSYFLSQFGDGKYDLQMNDNHVKTLFKETLSNLVSLGVKGFRLANAKHFIINKELKDELDVRNPNYDLLQYGFWSHSQTTYQEGLGPLLHEFARTVYNTTDGDGFLSVSEDITRPEVFKIKSGSFAIDIPMYGPLTYTLKLDADTTNRNLKDDLVNTFTEMGNATWLQWNCEFAELGAMNPSAYNIFISILPGVPVYLSDSVLVNNVSDAVISHLETIRSSASYMHGSFDIYHSTSLVAYSRIKSGNPGYFVILNPTDQYTTGNFTSGGLPDKMTVDLRSDNFNATDLDVKSKVATSSVPMPPFSAIVLTYVPVKSG
uniref:alpha-glucosidase n=1 Tax=Tabanus bromius TaxID=304241 RepID=A0A0K8TTJ8_TABBR